MLRARIRLHSRRLLRLRPLRRRRLPRSRLRSRPIRSRTFRNAEAAKPQAPAQPAPQAPQFEAPQPVAPGEPPAGPAVAANVVEAIQFRGARRVPQDTLRAMIFSKVGDVYNEDTLRRDFMLSGTATASTIFSWKPSAASAAAS